MAGMNLQIRHPKARQLARRIADLRRVSMTEAVVDALAADLARRENRESVAETVTRLHEELRRIGKRGGRDLTKEELDELWGHPPDESAA